MLPGMPDYQKNLDPASAFRPVVSCISPASAFRHQGQSGTAVNTLAGLPEAHSWPCYHSTNHEYWPLSSPAKLGKKTVCVSPLVVGLIGAIGRNFGPIKMG